MPNRLAQETSPYLLQHRDNPVDWMPWGEEAFARARADGKPVLLSIGYAACHWCHVMAHESFENPAIADLMNTLFVNIKVDREERPDLDQIYQSALALLGQHGGWPLTMFLTPEGEPFWGGTYFPPESRWGRPGFPDVLRGVADTCRREPDKVVRNVTALKEALGQLSENRPGDGIGTHLLDQIADRLAREVDPVWGGIGRAPKFPQPAIMELLWRGWLRTGAPPLKEAVVRTLVRMCQGGIYDHLGGGFARYSTDEEWLVPHFEKMLYDNAQLIDNLTLVWQGTREPLFEQRVRETVAWLMREMSGEPRDGVHAFASTLDADSEGVEGKFYVWSKAGIDRLLGPDAPVFAKAYDVSAHGNWEETNILNRRHDTALKDPATEAVLARCRAVLLAERDKRIRPGWDDKVLADWNGLAIAALANAGQVFDEPGWIDAAAGAFAFVARHMTAPDGRLRHSWRQGRLKHPASIDDHANMCRAALALFEATSDPSYLDQARAWVDVADRHYWDAERGGYFFTADDAERLIVRTKHAHDNATPSGNGTMLGVLARLFHMTGEDAFRERADALLSAFAGEVGRNFFPLGTLLNNADLLMNAVQVVIAGKPGEPAVEALRRAVLDRPLPNRILTVVPPGTALPPGHPAFGKGPVEGRPAAYVCRGMTCSPPVGSAEALGALLDRH